MIPAILAAPVVESVLGGVVNQVESMFSSPDSTPASATAFNSKLNSATAAAAPVTTATASTGSMRAEDWGQMSVADQKSWVQGLAGKHVDATDASGRTISGVVGGMQMLGSTLAVNIGGHLVSLSQLKQVSWSPAVA